MRAAFSLLSCGGDEDGIGSVGGGFEAAFCPGAAPGPLGGRFSRGVVAWNRVRLQPLAAT